MTQPRVFVFNWAQFGQAGCVEYEREDRGDEEESGPDHLMLE